MSRVHSTQDVWPSLEARHGSRIFIHFVDHEVLRRTSVSARQALPAFESLIRLVILISPEPALFPMSARHEHRYIANLLYELEPFFAAGVLQVTGAGGSPAAYLDRRRAQFDLDQHYFSELFSGGTDDLMERVGSVWIEKRGDSTRDIGDAWQSDVLNPRHNIVSGLNVAQGQLPDRLLDRLVAVPGTVGRRPLIADVVISELRRQGVLRQAAANHVREDVARFLTGGWMHSYVDDLDAVVLRDFGLLPARMETVSASRALSAVDRLGLHPLVDGVPHAELARLLTEIADVRMDVAYDIFARASAVGRPIWTVQEGAILRYFDKTVARRGFSVRYRRASRESQRAIPEMERRIAGYADALVVYGERSMNRSATVTEKYEIGQVGGDVNIASGRARIVTMKQSTLDPAATLPRDLVDALDTDEHATAFVASLLRADHIKGVKQTEIERAVLEGLRDANLSDDKLGRLRRVGADLATKASGSLLATGVLEGIRAVLSL
jgi:hypothetical protein